MRPSRHEIRTKRGGNCLEVQSWPRVRVRKAAMEGVNSGPTMAEQSKSPGARLRRIALPNVARAAGVDQTRNRNCTTAGVARVMGATALFAILHSVLASRA